MTITTSSVWNKVKELDVDPEDRNLLYCVASWELGLAVGKNAYRKFVKSHGKVGVPSAKQVNRRSVVGNAGDLNHAIKVAQFRLAIEKDQASAQQENTTPVPQEDRQIRVHTTDVVRALPTIVVAMSKPGTKNPTDSFYKAMRYQINKGKPLSAALNTCLTPEARQMLALLVDQGVFDPTSIPGVKFRSVV